MKLAFYTGIRTGWRGLGNVLTRFRLRSPISHCELVFERGDGVDELMPDGSLYELADRPWCASSIAAEPLPAWSPRRAGRSGGVRLTRIDLNSPYWVLLDVPNACAEAAARWFIEQQGAPYDWQGIFGFIAWPISHKAGRFTCHEACAAALGFPDPDRLNPALLHAVQRYANKPLQRGFFYGGGR